MSSGWQGAEMESVSLYVALSAEQGRSLMDDGCICCQWFGGGGSIPLKKTLEAAVEAYIDALKYKQQIDGGLVEIPAYVVVVTIAAKWYMGLSHSGLLRHVPWHYGYRYHEDICVKHQPSFCELVIHPCQW